MTRNLRRIAAALLVLLTAACANYSLIEPGVVQVEDAYSFTLDRKWSKSTSSPNHHLLTLDGPSLQFIEISTGIGDKNTLMSGSESTKAPPYNKAMTLLEMQDFIRDSFTAVGAEQFSMTSFAPAPFGAWPGFRAEFEFLTAGGLQKRGLLVGAQQGDKLYTINYVAAAMFYYDKSLPDAEAIIRSVRETKKS